MIEYIKTKLSKRTTAMVALLFIAMFSILVVSRIVTAPGFNAETMDALDDKQVTVTRLAVTAAAASTAISLIPGDVAMPIANQTAELTVSFMAIPASVRVSDSIYDDHRASVERTFEVAQQSKEFIEEQRI